MPEMIGIFISLFAAIVPIIIIGTIVYIIVAATKRNNNGGSGFKLSSKLLLQLYLYVLSFLTLVLAVIGGTNAIKAGISYSFDVPFSYTLNKVASPTTPIYYDSYEPSPYEKEISSQCYSGDPVEFKGKMYCFDENQRKMDLINGITLLVSMALLFSMHRFALSRIPEESLIPWARKLYTFGSLILFSIVSIAALPTAIYQLTNFILFEPTTNSYSTPVAPATAIALTILAIPLWMFFLRETINLKDEE